MSGVHSLMVGNANVDTFQIPHARRWNPDFEMTWSDDGELLSIDMFATGIDGNFQHSRQTFDWVDGVLVSATEFVRV